MENVPRFNDALSWLQYRIAACDEIDLEAIVWLEREPEDAWVRRYHEADRAALREIERLKLRGEYEAERARLATYLPGSLVFARRINSNEFAPAQNFLDGLKSPDSRQRERFERLYQKSDLADKTPREIWHILECLEPAKKQRDGRPKIIPPWRNVVAYLDAMRFAVRSGASIPQAAKAQAEIEGLMHAGSRAQYFERLYRKRQRLREIK